MPVGGSGAQLLDRESDPGIRDDAAHPHDCDLVAGRFVAEVELFVGALRRVRERIADRSGVDQDEDDVDRNRRQQEQHRQWEQTAAQSCARSGRRNRRCGGGCRHGFEGERGR